MKTAELLSLIASGIQNGYRIFRELKASALQTKEMTPEEVEAIESKMEEDLKQDWAKVDPDPTPKGNPSGRGEGTWTIGNGGTP